MQATTDDTKRFLDTWFAACPTDQQLEVRPLHKTATPLAQNWFATAEQAEAYVRKCHAHGDDVYCGARPRLRRGGKEADVGASHWCWSDVDVGTIGHKSPSKYATCEDALVVIDALPIKPAMIVNTGGGLHLWYRFAETPSQAVWTAAQKLICNAVGGDANALDAPRILRIPGTSNYKTGEARPVTLVRCTEDTITIEQINALPPVAAEPVKASASAATREGAQVERRRPFDLANDVPIDQVFDWLGVKTHQEGDRLYSACPVHHGSNESQMVVGGERNVATCYGDCSGRAYTAVDLVAAHHRIEAIAAVNIMADRFGFTGFKSRETPMTNAANYALTDLGNAERLVAAHGDRLRHSSSLGWLWHDGRRWARADGGEVMRAAISTVREIYGEAQETDNERMRRDIASHATRSESASRLEAMIKLAQSHERVAIGTTELDANPMLFNVSNGTIDLRTGAIRNHNGSDLITKLAPIEHDATATCPVFVGFLERIFDGNQELIGFVKRLSGYCLTGSVSEQVIVFLYGLGANGKSTLLSVLLGLLGEYGRQAAPELLLAKRGDMSAGDASALADLFGARLAVCTEIESGRSFDEVAIKQITGGDRMKAKRMRQDWWEFAPTHKVLVAANNKPIIRGTDHAIWRRMRLLPCEATITQAEKDIHLGAKLNAELPGILNWAIEGCLEWQKTGLGEPATIKKATQGYRDEMDIIGGFIADQCILSDARETGASALFVAYVRWSTRREEKPISQTAFGMRLRERGFVSARDSRSGLKTWTGIGFKALQSVAA